MYPQILRSKWLPVPQPRSQRGSKPARESLVCRMGGPPKPCGPASPVNMSKRGLFARLHAPNQTLTRVKTWLPNRNLAGKTQARSASYKGRNGPFRGARARSGGATHPGFALKSLPFFAAVRVRFPDKANRPLALSQTGGSCRQVSEGVRLKASSAAAGRSAGSGATCAVP